VYKYKINFLENMENLYKIIIASYLHDIWKLFVRAWFFRITNDFEVSHAEHLKSIFENWSEYIEKNLWLNNSLQEKLEKINKSDFWKEIAILWSLHHWRDFSNFSKNYDKDFRKMIFCVYMADNLASKDRLSENEEENLEKANFRNQWLTSIFENIFDFSKEKKFTNNFCYEAKTLSKENIWNLIPKKQKTDFTGLANSFLEEFVSLIYENIELNSLEKLKIFVYKLDILLQKYFSFVPSDVYQWKLFDLSLYDHTKLVVANAVVLYNKFFVSEKLKNLTYSTKDIENEEITLIAWDFPSIQKYIFGWIKKQKYISKRLRARSLRVQLLNEAVLEYILDILGLPRANILMNAWWKFVIIYDKLWENFKKLNLWEKINDFLLERFSWNIKINLVSKDYKISDIFEINKKNNVKDVFVDIFDELSKNKFQIYSKQNLEKIFTKKDVSSKKLCKFCEQNYLDNIEDENDENAICKNCRQEINLWEKIVKNSFWVALKFKNKEKFDYNEEILDEKNFFEKINKKSENELFVIFNNWEYLFWKENKIISKSINLYVPKNKNFDTKSFEEIIKDDKNKENWLDYICMLKGDIDAMSLLFKYGFSYDLENKEFKKSFYSINRLTQFSRFLELFFGFYLDEKIRKNFENVYTVFSGWDDFVFILPFSKRQEFINFLIEEFNNFVAWNKKIHFSLWLWIFKEKTPFKTMDEKTESLLKKAKAESKAKNDINNLDNLLKYRWLTIYEEDFTKIFIDEKIDFEDWIKNFKIDDEKMIIWDTQKYRIYEELSKFRDILKQEKNNYWDLILIWARILNMLERNDRETKEKQEFQNLKKYIWELIRNFEIWKQKQKIEKINNLLLWIIDSLYKERYFNN